MRIINMKQGKFLLKRGKAELLDYKYEARKIPFEKRKGKVIGL